MKSVIVAALAALTLCTALLSLSGAGSAAAAGPTAEFSATGIFSTTATPTDSETPAGPVDPGTGETPAAKDTRVDYAPYVVAAVVLLSIAAAALAWRRWGGPSSKPARHGQPEGDRRAPHDSDTAP